MNINRKLLKELLFYSEDSGEFVWRERSINHFDDGKGGALRRCNIWNARYSGKVAGSLNKLGYIVISIFNEPKLAHRLAWVFVYGSDSNCIDHINHIRSDNRIDNLRSISKNENHWNMNLYKTNKYGISGVYRVRNGNMWMARITKKQKVYHLGTFDSFDKAAAARKEAEVLHGFHVNHGFANV